MSPATKRKWKRRHRLFLVGAITTLFLIVGIAGAIMTQGNVRGVEFSPTHFQTRQFSFFELPLFHLQLTPIRRKATTAGPSRYLRANNLVNLPQGRPTHWHLVRLSRGITPPVAGDADILVQYLRLDDDGNEYWKQWSADHPQLARQLWSRIQRLAKRELYVLMPDLFEQAKRATTSLSPQQFSDQIDPLMRDATRRLAKDMQQAGRSDFARELLSEALQDFPDDPRLQAALDALPPAADDLSGQR